MYSKKLAIKSETKMNDALEEISTQRPGLGVLPSAAKMENRVGRLINDNCVVLIRGENYWYFPEALLYTPLYNNVLRLHSGDVLLTMPISSIKFSGTKIQPPYTFFEIDPVGEYKQVAIDENASPQIANLIAYDSGPWTTTIISRTEGDKIHHLVMHSGALDVPRKMQDDISKTITDLNLQPGDVVRKTHITDFVNRFDTGNPF